MKNPLENLHKSLGLGLVLTVLVFLLRGHYTIVGDSAFWLFLFRYIHVFFGILWIGLLYYFNFVQTPSMPKIPDDQKPAVTKVIAPTALFWFRWAALSTVIFGLILAYMNGYLIEALSLGSIGGGAKATAIGLGMWLGLIMAYNVWMIIWPNQQKILGLVEATPDEKKVAAKAAGMASRFNTMASIPMLYFMAAASHIY
jgi:uncharacterized membrane protein